MLFRTLGAVLAVGFVLAAAQVPASAEDTPAPTRFSEFAITPDTIDVDHPTVTYTGRLVFTDAAGAEEGVPGATVCLRKDTGCLLRTNTGADGRFTGSVTLSTEGDHPGMVEGNAFVSYSGSKDFHFANLDPGIYLHVTPAATRITMAFEPVPSVIGDQVDVVGLFEREKPDGGWIAVRNQPVRVYVGDTQVGLGLTAADGRYRITTTVPGSGSWHVETPFIYPRPLPYAPGNGPYVGARADGDPVTARYRTTITGFNASPEPVGRNAMITVGGRVTRMSANGAVEPATGTPMVQFSTDGKKWADVLAARPDAEGYFTVTTPAVRDGYWRADTSRAPGDGELPATSGADYVDVRYRTAISGFNASPEPIAKGKRLTVAGTLKRDTTSWKAFSGQSVQIYFAAKGATSWTYEGSAKTSPAGHFSHAFNAVKDGTWRATYAGTTTYLAVTGTGDYVDVR
ncbi:hypothetical protein [Actinomadura sp. DC4]|uniref:hypothetical protein n=1 Tax=Actinomadura sp. DC4 TaxID=3055069 RepID=UPI0025B05C89|nr:hypothetical protein [Actinomadura sp. DC4]MDN3352986.1 hypothetical protein [Actinomadura sp. DC4]